MGSLIDELQRREAAARQEAEDLRGQIAQLAERLAQAEERLSRLVITRETVDEVLTGSGAEATPATVMPDGVAASRSGHLRLFADYLTHLACRAAAHHEIADRHAQHLAQPHPAFGQHREQEAVTQVACPVPGRVVPGGAAVDDRLDLGRQQQRRPARPPAADLDQR
jgi:hypothetical protein